MSNTEIINGSLMVYEYERLIKGSDAPPKELITTIPDRPKKQKASDTVFNHVGEDVFNCVLKEYNMHYVACDELREVNFKKIAPLSGLLCKTADIPKAKQLIDSINKTITSTSNANGKLPASMLSEIQQAGMRTIDIKATRITDRYRTDGAIDLAKIKMDDILISPNDLRNSSLNYSLETYADYMLSSGKIKYTAKMDKVEALRAYEVKHLIDIYVRIFIDEKLQTAVIVGFLKKEDFVANMVFRKVKEHYKPELTLYYAVPLAFATPITQIAQAM